MTEEDAKMWTREFDKCIVRKMHYEGGTYERHMNNGRREFFSKVFYGNRVVLKFDLNGNDHTFTVYVYDNYTVKDTTRNEDFELYGNVHTLKHMLRHRSFANLNQWGAACWCALDHLLRPI
jgi:hypothetical protein